MDDFDCDDEFLLKTIQYIYENSDVTFAAINCPIYSTTHTILNVMIELLS